MKLKMFFVILIIVLISWPLFNVRADNGLPERAKSIVRRSLKDPESARFRNVHVCKGNIVRGEFNAKNGYGGYSGYEKFYVKIDKKGNDFSCESSFLESFGAYKKALYERKLYLGEDATQPGDLKNSPEYKERFIDGW
ncbi:MAG: hypothetical protein HKK66_03335 [Chlorobiaceae bacterium]|nr:hypothetical protein [Chlorobiaceae bacterium]